MNEKIFYYLNSLLGKSIIFDKVVLFLSNNFGYFLIAISFLFLLLHHDTTKYYPDNKKRLRQKTKEIIILLGSTFFAWALVLIVKKMFNNPRPFILYPDIQTLFIYGGEDSFPSGHAAFYGALAVSIFAYHKRVGTVFAMGAVLIGLARVVSGVHFPLDILMGFIFGASVSVLVYYTIRTLAKKYKKYIDFLFNCV
ncbi:MAG: phosphatase PAP2 family protein [Candidatus Pacebacteria bacterium]|nr:phosphatase PAP2 family protein [Candidatus Paceibacterota bacterium]